MQQNTFIVEGNVVDIKGKEIYFGKIIVENGKIKSVNKIESFDSAIKRFILPGFIDSHVHIESSMVIPSEFARLAATHGTVATVSDPHEIANVCGAEGVEWMLDDVQRSAMKICFGAPSCVP